LARAQAWICGIIACRHFSIISWWVPADAERPGVAAAQVPAEKAATKPDLERAIMQTGPMLRATKDNFISRPLDGQGSAAVH